jgi:L-fucose mutarotase
MGSVERFAFYELAKKSCCVIQTGERRFYGCFAFRSKGAQLTRIASRFL